MATEIILDVHELQSPEPMELALDALDALQPGEYIKMLHRMQPFPLYNMLYDNGFKFKAVSGITCKFDIYIWIATDKASEEFIENNIAKY